MVSLQNHVQELHDQGFTLIKQALKPKEVALIKKGVERSFLDPEDGYGSLVRVRMFERGEEFEPLLDHSPIVDFAETVLGENCHMIANSALITPKHTGFYTWHTDDEPFLPLPEGVELDARIQAPVFILNCMYYLVDVREDMGPTQFVPGSHRSGRKPDPSLNYKGKGPLSILAKSGDCLIFNGQTWHRGARNESDMPRIVQQVVYGKRIISQRFYPFINYTMPQKIIDRANPRRKRILGLHPRGPYG